MKLEGRNVVCFGGFSGGIECPEVNQFPVGTNPSAVFPIAEGDSFYSSSAVGVNPSIALVLGFSRFPEIVFLAIKPVAVDVVNFIFGESHHKSVKGYIFAWPSLLRDTGHRIKSVLVFLDSPLKAAHHVRVVIINQCRLALGKFNLDHSKIVPNFTVTETTPPGIKNKRKENEK
jgi:hypothetical protein